MIETSPQISATPSQDRLVDSMLTVRDLIKTIDGQEILRGVDLDVADLEGQEEKMPVSLSGGMKKRVGLARSIIRRPKCVLYDEPTSGLDPVVADSINRLIRRLQKRLGMTSIVVTHDMKSAFDV